MLGHSDGSPRTCTAGGERINPYGPEGHTPTGIEEEVVNRRRCHRGSLALSPDPLVLERQLGEDRCTTFSTCRLSRAAAVSCFPKAHCSSPNPSHRR
jgi:hypothetical protein